MADLRYIMHMEDDGDPGNDKYSRRPSHFGSARSSNPSSTAPGLDDSIQQTDIDPARSLQRQRTSPSRSPRLTATTSNTAATASANKASPSRTPLFEQRSVDSTRPMDLASYRRYAQSSSSSNMPQSCRSSPSSRSVGSVLGEPNLPVKLTPITGRVSRAKKGVPVHTCDICKPSKTFTRAEHLRRHQLSHRPANFQCPYPRCDKVFFRQDLLTRHIQRHEQDEGSGVETRRSTSRRSSHPPAERHVPSPGYLLSNMPGNDMSIAEEIPRSSSYAGLGSPYSPSHRSSISGHGPLSPPGHSPRSHSTSHSHSHSHDQGYILSSTSQMSHIGYHDSSMDGSHFSSKAYRQAFQPRRSPSFTYTGLEGLGTELPNLTIPDGDLVGQLCTESNWSSSASDSPYSTPDKVAIRSCSSPNDVPDPALFFVNPQFPSTQQSVYQQITDYAPPYVDETSCYEFAHPFPVRSPTPLPVSLSTQPAEHLVTIGRSVPDPPSILGRRKASAAILNPYSDAASLSAQVSSAAALNAIPRYLVIYWKRFDTLFPLVHRWNSETSADPVLRSAMAALGSQFLPSKEDRINSQLLYDFASQEAGHYSRWNVQVMQTILLCEFYARFRGSRVLSRPSKLFQSLYSRIATPLIPDHDLSSSTGSERWDEWIATESCRRLLAACFVLDVHTSMYHEHSTIPLIDTQKPHIPLTKHTQRLWAARNLEEWEDLITSESDQLKAVSLADIEVTADLIATAPPLDRAVYLASETIRLPRRPFPPTFDRSTNVDFESTKRISVLFPQSAIANTYLALYYTPLRDLLAVSSDSWGFSRKVFSLEDSEQRKEGVRKWSDSIHAGAASIFAAKALLVILDIHDDTPESRSLPGETWNMTELSDYWALYVCALVCWSLGQRTANGAIAHEIDGSAESPSISEAASSKAESEIIDWLKTMANSTPEAVMQNIQGRQESLSVISMVKRRLGNEVVAGSKSKLLIDAVRALESLEEDPDRRRF